jgi:hypothetical protein
MRASACRTAILAVFVTTLTSAPAEAGILSWLSKLSGPGWFWGSEISYAVKCFPKAKPDEESNMSGSGVVYGCPDRDLLTDAHFGWYVTGGLSVAFDSNLDYTSQQAQPGSDNVYMVKFGTALDYGVWPRWADIGVGSGFRYFAGARFENFALPYVQLRLTLRPLTFADKNWLLISINRELLVGRIDGARFGAPDDPRLHETNEWLWEFGVSFDIEAFRNRRLR